PENPRSPVLAGKQKTALHLKLADRQRWIRVSCVIGQRLRRNRLSRIGIESAHAAVEAFGHRAFILPAQAEIQCQLPGYSPVVVNVEGPVGGFDGLAAIAIYGSCGGLAEKQGGKSLANAARRRS